MNLSDATQRYHYANLGICTPACRSPRYSLGRYWYIGLVLFSIVFFSTSGRAADNLRLEPGSLSSLHTFRQRGVASSVALSPDGKTLAYASSLRAANGDYIMPVGPRSKGSWLQLWDVGTERVTHLLDCSASDELCFSPDGNILASGDNSGETRLWEVRSGKLKRIIPLHSTTCLSFSPNGRVLAVGSEDTISLYDMRTGSSIFRRKGIAGYPQKVVFNSDGNEIAVTFGGNESDETELAVWKWKNGQQLKLGPQRFYTATAGANDALFFLSKGSVLVRGDQIWTFQNHRSNSQALYVAPGRECLAPYANNSNLVLFVKKSNPKGLELWDIKRRKRDRTWEIPQHRAAWFSDRIYILGTRRHIMLALENKIEAVSLWKLSYNGPIN